MTQQVNFESAIEVEIDPHQDDELHKILNEVNLSFWQIDFRPPFPFSLKCWQSANYDLLLVNASLIISITTRRVTEEKRFSLFVRWLKFIWLSSFSEAAN